MKPRGVTIAISRDPALVRTVRLVAAAVARRAGQGEETVEEVRLAVGEACAQLVGYDSVPVPGADPSVVIRLDIADRFRVQVTGETTPDTPGVPPLAGTQLDPWALLRGINDEVQVVQAHGATAVSMSWPLA